MKLQSSLLNRLVARRFSGGNEYARLQRMHEQLADVEALFAKYRMDKFTDPKQVDDLLNRNIIPPVMAANLKEEIAKRQEALSMR
jgi:hypothetical protein